MKKFTTLIKLDNPAVAQKYSRRELKSPVKAAEMKKVVSINIVNIVKNLTLKY